MIILVLDNSIVDKYTFLCVTVIIENRSVSIKNQYKITLYILTHAEKSSIA